MHPLWLCLRFPSLPLEALQLPGDGPCVVFERQRQRKLLVCGNPAADALGLAPGMELGAAAALSHHSLTTFERNPRAEREALRTLAAAAYGFSSQVSVQPAAPAPDAHAMWLEVGASLKLFGGREALVAQLTRTVNGLGYHCEAGIAPTPEGARLLAGREPVPDREALWRALGALPLAGLPLDPETRAALAGSGLRSFGEVLAMPLDALARRFSPAFTDWIGRATGRLPDTRRLYRPPAQFHRLFEFAGAAETTEALRGTVNRLLAELAAYLVARDTGACGFTFEFGHEAGASTLEVGLGSPSRDAVHLQVLAQARLEQLQVAAPVLAVTLHATRFAPVRVRQLDLFSTRTQEDDEWQAVLDRLRSRLGPAAVHGLGLRADHRPEKSWSETPFDTPLKARAGTAAEIAPGTAADEPDKPRPLWLLPEPRALSAAPHCLRGPERIESGWWDGADAQRDYYVADTPAGAQLWVYREQPSGRWFLHGLWA